MKQAGIIGLLKDILESSDIAIGYLARCQKREFLRNIEKQDAVLRRIEVIGEAARNLPLDFSAKYPQVEWSRIIATRNRLIHGYNQVDFEIVWQLVKSDLPALRSRIEKILEKEKEARR